MALNPAHLKEEDLDDDNSDMDEEEEDMGDEEEDTEDDWDTDEDWETTMRRMRDGYYDDVCCYDPWRGRRTPTPPRVTNGEESDEVGCSMRDCATGKISL